MTNLITLDGMSHFPREFLDLKAFNSNKAQAVGDDGDSSVDEDLTQNNRQSNYIVADDRQTRTQLPALTGNASVTV